MKNIYYFILTPVYCFILIPALFLMSSCGKESKISPASAPRSSNATVFTITVKGTDFQPVSFTESDYVVKVPLISGLLLGYYENQGYTPIRFEALPFNQLGITYDLSFAPSADGKSEIITFKRVTPTQPDNGPVVLFKIVAFTDINLMP